MEAKIYRHGDVMLLPVELSEKVNPQFRIQKMDKDKQGRHILAYGEATGHYHAVEGANIMEVSGGLVLEIPEGKTGTVKHLGYSGPLEHDDISLPPGLYVPIQQHEYDIVQGWRQVAD